jgi:hypothetical protein
VFAYMCWRAQAEREAESFETQFPVYMRTTPHTAISSPADPGAVWEEWVFDPTLLPIRLKLLVYLVSFT